jgi:pyrimidine deaminase RibD-like protein
VPDHKKFTAAYARLASLRNNMPSYVDEQRAKDYHSIVESLQQASGDDLSSFLIPADEMKRDIIASSPAGFRGRARGRIVYSDKKYCDRDFFARQVEALYLYLDLARKAITASRMPLSDERPFQLMAVEEARKSVAEHDGKPRPKVGAVVVKDGQVLGKTFRGEIPKCHAEYILLERKLKDSTLSGATVFTTLEPCTRRNPPKEPCVNRLAARNIKRVVIGMLDPNASILGKGVRHLRKAGIEVAFFAADLMAEVEELNREFADYCEEQEGVMTINYESVEVTKRPESEDSFAPGKRWVEETLTRLLKERNRTLDSPPQWVPDFDREVFTMTAKVDGHPKVHRLSYEALEDCVADKNVQRAIENTLRAFFVPEIPLQRRGRMDMPHEQVVTTYPVAIKMGQRRLHVPNPIPWHVRSQTIKCPDCETTFIVTEGFPQQQLFETLKQQHRSDTLHPDYIASAPEWTRVAACDCEN